MNTTINNSAMPDAMNLLSTALDASGYISIRGLGTGPNKRMQPRQKFFVPGDFTGAAAYAMQLSNQGYDSYFSTVTFLTNKSAEAHNAKALKCFKIDLDVNPNDPKKYASKRDAVISLTDFCTAHSFPVPVLVDSGYGVHGYWCLSEALEAGDGKLYSEKLKSLFIAYGLRHDVTVTGDLVRVLRVPDTLNNKQAVARRVKLKSPVAPIDTDTILDRIDDLYANTPDLPTIDIPNPALNIGQLPAHLRSIQLDKDTVGLIQGKPKSFKVLIKRCNAGHDKGCAQIKDIYDKQSQQSEDRWRAGLSIARFCDDGEKAIHDLSNRDKARYNFDETEKKATLIKGPYKCSTFESSWPNLCMGCPQKGKITSPIQLAIIDEIREISADAVSNDAAAIARLAALNPMQYDRVRVNEAKSLGVRTGVLDAQVEAVRKARQGNANFPFSEVEPWDEEVNIADLLHEISATVRRYIVCEPEVTDTAALWAAMTWVVDALKIAPLAVVTAPEKRCGKSEFRRLMAKFVCRPLEADGMSASVLFRGFDLWRPTLLVDEFDTFVQDDEDLRGIFNAGHQRGGCIWRCVGEDHEPRRFDVFGPKLLAGIGKLPGTMMDRAIIFELRRKLPHEKVERLRYADDTAFDVLRQKLTRFGMDFLEAIRTARPSLSETLNDRQQDNWEPLLAIADLAGRDWPDLARQAALKLSADKEDAASIGVELLADIHEIFAEKGITRIFSFQLVHGLCRDDRRWCNHNRGGNITAAQVARILKGYGIRPKQMRIDTENAKGYEKEQFTDAWERYLIRPH